MGKDGTRHDHAILLTGLDICSWKNEPCDTLGKILQYDLEGCGSVSHSHQRLVFFYLSTNVLQAKSVSSSRVPTLSQVRTVISQVFYPSKWEQEIQDCLMIGLD